MDLFAMTPEEAVQAVERRKAVEDALSALTLRGETAVREFFGFNDGVPKTYGAIGKQLGVGRERARQIVVSSLCKFRNPYFQKRLLVHAV